MTTGFIQGRALRPTRKVLPGQARGHNRSLVLQTLYRDGGQSRADIARATGLTRVTVSDLVGELIDEGLILELGTREDPRPGKPATLLQINGDAFHIIGVDLSDSHHFRGAVLDIHGSILHRERVSLDAATGQDATERVAGLIRALQPHATAPILGIGIGSPGVVDLTGTVLSAPNLGWEGEHLQQLLADEFDLPVIVANDANAAALAEHSFGNAARDLMVITIGHGVGAGLILGGTPHFGSSFAAGEIGHVVVGTTGGLDCACGKQGCLETWLATPRLETALGEARATGTPDDEILARAGHHLGLALAPVVGALNLAEIVVSGPAPLLDGPLLAAAVDTLRTRTSPAFHGQLQVRMTTLGDDIVTRGAAAMVLAGQLGVS